MRTYEELKDLGTEELQRIEGIFGNRSKFLKLKKEEKTGLMQDYMYLYCKTLPQYDTKKDRRMYTEIKINSGLEKTFQKIARAGYDGKGVKEELQSSLIVEYAAGVSLYGKKDVSGRIEKYHNDIMFNFDKVQAQRAAEQKKIQDRAEAQRKRDEESLRLGEERKHERERQRALQAASKTKPVKEDLKPQTEMNTQAQPKNEIKAKPKKARQLPKIDFNVKKKKLFNTSRELDVSLDQMKEQIKDMEQANKGLFSNSRKFDNIIGNANALVQLTEDYKRLEKADLSPAKRKQFAEKLIKNCDKMREISDRYKNHKMDQGKLDEFGLETNKMDKSSRNRLTALVTFDDIVDRLKKIANSNRITAELDIKDQKSQQEEYDKISARVNEYDKQAENADDIQKVTLNEATERIERVMKDNMTNYQDGSIKFNGIDQKKLEYCVAAVMLNDLIETKEGMALKKIAPNDPMQYKSFIRSVADSISFKRALPEGLNNPKSLSRFLSDKNASLDMGKAYMKDMEAEIKTSHNITNRTQTEHKPEVKKILQ